MKVFKNFPTALYIAISALLLLAMTTTAYADTYNFYFDKPKKGVQKEASAPETSDTAQESPATHNAVQEAPAQTPPEFAAPAASAPPAPEKQSVVVPNGNTPIVIHNNITVPNTVQAPAPQSAPVAPPPEVSAAPVASVSAVVVDPPKRRPPWRLGLSAMAAVARASSYSSIQEDAHNFSSGFSSRSMRDDAAGSVVSLGYRFTPGFGLNAYAGSLGAGNHIVGLDAELMPIRLDVGAYDLFELGGILGVSNVRTSYSSDRSLAHLGIRFNVNIGPSFSLTSSARINASYSVAEAGFTVNL